MTSPPHSKTENQRTTVVDQHSECVHTKLCVCVCECTVHHYGNTRRSGWELSISRTRFDFQAYMFTFSFMLDLLLKATREQKKKSISQWKADVWADGTVTYHFKHLIYFFPFTCVSTVNPIKTGNTVCHDLQSQSEISQHHRPPAIKEVMLVCWVIIEQLILNR